MIASFLVKRDRTLFQNISRITKMIICLAPMKTGTRSGFLCRQKIIAAIISPILLLFPTTLFSQNINTPHRSTDSLFQAQQLKDDLLILRQSLEEGHPGLYRYTPKDELDKRFDEIDRRLDHPMSEIEFYMLVDPLITDIHCGHTRLALSVGTNALFNNLPISIPFSFKFIGQKTYLLYNYSENTDLEMGGEVISIDGKPIDEIVAPMLPLINANAHIQTSKYRYLEKANNFSRWYALLYGQRQSFTIVYRSLKNAKMCSLQIKGISKEAMTKISKERYPGLHGEVPPITLRYDNDLPILTIRTFEGGCYEDFSISYADFMKKAFEEFKEKGAANLIVDLRDNDGGDDEKGNLLTAYLLDKPYDYYKSCEFKKDEYTFLGKTNISAEDAEMIKKVRERTRMAGMISLNTRILGSRKSVSRPFPGAFIF